MRTNLSKAHVGLHYRICFKIMITEDKVIKKKLKTPQEITIWSFRFCVLVEDLEINYDDAWLPFVNNPKI